MVSSLLLTSLSCRVQLAVFLQLGHLIPPLAIGVL